MNGSAFNLPDAPVLLDSGSGYALSVMHSRIAELIQDYDPTLELAWIPPDKRLPLDKDKEFAVICRPGNAPDYIVMKIKEQDVNESVIAALLLADNKQASVIDRLEACDFADEVTKAKADYEAEQLRMDFVQSVIKSPLHTYRHDGKVYK